MDNMEDSETRKQRYARGGKSDVTAKEAQRLTTGDDPDKVVQVRCTMQAIKDHDGEAEEERIRSFTSTMNFHVMVMRWRLLSEWYPEGSRHVPGEECDVIQDVEAMEDLRTMWRAWKVVVQEQRQEREVVGSSDSDGDGGCCVGGDTGEPSAFGTTGEGGPDRGLQGSSMTTASPLSSVFHG